MKKAFETYVTRVLMLFLAVFGTVTAMAQEGGVEVSKTSTTTSSSTETVPADWYTAPWVWVVGAIVLLLIIIAMARGNKSTVATTTKVTRTTEVD